MTGEPDGSGPRFLARQAWTRVWSLAPRRSDWTSVRWGRDLPAGLMVGLVALPLALGFGVSSGMGATAGLVTAVVAAIFGGSRVQVSGPTGVMTVVLVPIIATYGTNGVLVVGLLAGLVLIGLGCAGAGRFIRYVPVPVVEGFTLGIAAIILLQQMPSARGVRAEGEKVLGQAVGAVGQWASAPHWAAVVVATAVVAGVLGLARLRPGIPWTLAVVVLATAANGGVRPRPGDDRRDTRRPAGPVPAPDRRVGPRIAAAARRRRGRPRRAREPALSHGVGRHERRTEA